MRINDTCLLNNDPLIGLYEQVLAKPKPHDVLHEQTETVDQLSPEQFKIRRVKIYVKRGDNNPEMMYRADVIDYDEREAITTITAETADDRQIIVKKQDNFIDVTVMDQNNNIQDEFNVHGMQFQDIDNPDELSILKVEQID